MFFPGQEEVFFGRQAAEGRWGTCGLRGLWVVASACSLIGGLPIPPLRVLTLRLLMLGLWRFPGLKVLERRVAPNLHHHRGGEKKAKCWPSAQSKMFLFFPGQQSLPAEEMLLSSETCWAHDLGGIEGFGV